MAPLVTTTVTPAAIIAQAGQATNLTVTNAGTSGYPVNVSWTATPTTGSGITVSPGSGRATLAPGASASTQIAVTPATQGTTQLPVTTSVAAGRLTLPGSGAYPQLTVPYTSTSAAFDNTGITDDSDHSPGNFDGYGNSFSAEALSDAGIPPGGQVASGGVSFSWPSAAAGDPDNVLAAFVPLPSGKTVA